MDASAARWVEILLTTKMWPSWKSSVSSKEGVKEEGVGHVESFSGDSAISGVVGIAPWSNS